MRVLPLLPAAPLALLGVIGIKAIHHRPCRPRVPIRRPQSKHPTCPPNFLADLGRAIFRFDTFGDEQLWTGLLRMHEPIAKLSPKQALAVGLKVDLDALPPAVVAALKAGLVNLDDPAVTLTLLRANAVVGVKGRVNAAGALTSVGITCALCHSTVDDALTPGIGHRLDGWAATSLDVGAIVALSPALDAATKAEFSTWGPGKYDPRHHYFDGTTLVPLNSPSLPIVIPPIYGLQRVGFETVSGDGPISVLEQLRRRRPDGRPRIVPRPAHRRAHQPAPRSGDAEAAAAAHLPAHAEEAGAARRQLRSHRGGARPRGVPWRRRLRAVSPGAGLHRRAERITAQLAGAARSRPRSAPRPSTRRERRPSAIAPRRCARSSSTRRTSTTAAPPRSRRWSSTTTRGSG